MHILITGAAGMIGRKLTERLVIDRALGGRGIEKLTLIDIVAPARPAGYSDHVKTRAADLAAPGAAEKAVAERPEVIFHLAGVVSGEAETDFEKGYRVNLDGTRALLEAIRAVGGGYRPKLVFTSSIAVFGAPFPPAIPDDFHLTPLTSYGTQKAISELLLADYTRRGVLEGVGIRLPSIVVRPGKPNKAASGFFSGIIREPLAGQEAILPVADSVLHWHASPRSAVGFLIHAAGLTRAQLGSRINLTMPGVCCTVGEQIAALRRIAGDKVAGSHQARAGRTNRTHRRRLAKPVRTAAGAGARLQGRGDIRRYNPRPYRGRTGRQNRLVLIKARACAARAKPYIMGHDLRRRRRRPSPQDRPDQDPRPRRLRGHAQGRATGRALSRHADRACRAGRADRKNRQVGIRLCDGSRRAAGHADVSRLQEVDLHLAQSRGLSRHSRRQAAEGGRHRQYRRDADPRRLARRYAAACTPSARSRAAPNG